jgi:SAM-dependent methyltransferase
MLARVEAEAERARVEVATLCADAAAMNVPEHDAAIAIHGPLSYVEDPQPIATGIARGVRRGGMIIFALPRAASLEQTARHPRRALAPLVRSPHRIDGTLDGRPFHTYLHDPRAFADRLAEMIDVEEISGCGLSRVLPDSLDVRLGRVRGLRNFGATTLIIGRRL